MRRRDTFYNNFHIEGLSFEEGMDKAFRLTRWVGRKRCWRRTKDLEGSSSIEVDTVVNVHQFWPQSPHRGVVPHFKAFLESKSAVLKSFPIQPTRMCDEIKINILQKQMGGRRVGSSVFRLAGETARTVGYDVAYDLMYRMYG